MEVCKLAKDSSAMSGRAFCTLLEVPSGPGTVLRLFANLNFLSSTAIVAPVDGHSQQSVCHMEWKVLLVRLESR